VGSFASFASLVASFLAIVRPLVDLGFSVVTATGAGVEGAGAVARAGADIVGLVNRFRLGRAVVLSGRCLEYVRIVSGCDRMVAMRGTYGRAGDMGRGETLKPWSLLRPSAGPNRVTCVYVYLLVSASYGVLRG